MRAKRRALRLLIVPVLAGASLLVTPRPTPAAVSPATIAAGETYTCALDDAGSLSCWGAMPEGVNVLPEGPFSDVDVGYYHACAVRQSGSIVCWGNPIIAELEAPPGDYLGVSVGSYHACGIRTDHEVVCWADPSDAPIHDVPDGPFHGLTSGGHTACALDASDEIVCWGDVLPNGPPSGAFAAIDLGLGAACGLRADGSVTCWGFRTPSFPDTYTAVTAGGHADCGLRTDGDIGCVAWDGGPPASLEGPYDQLAVGNWHLCARHGGGAIECFGAAAYPYWGVQPSIVSSLPAPGYVGAAYVHTFQTTGVVPAPSFTVTSGSLPDGLSLSISGILSGTPAAAGPSGVITVTASNGIAPPASQDFDLDIEVDASPPTLSGVGSEPLQLSRITNNWLMTRFTWEGADVGSGVARYQLERSADGGPFVRLANAIAGTSMDLWLAPWHTYEIRVRGVDRAGNIGAWTNAAAFRVVPYQDGGGKVVYDGSWSAFTSSAYFGGSLRASTTVGDTATLTFTGRWVAWVAAIGPTRGQAKVYVDGVLTKTVSLYWASGLPRKVMFTESWPTSGEHTINVVVSKLGSQTRTDVDAFLVGK